MIAHGCAIRTTAATGVNDTSSRSHAILRIYIQQPPTNNNHPPAVGSSIDGLDRVHLSYEPQPATQEGVLTLVDLAGSEFGIDSMYHSAERRKEGAAINASLMALKDCIRARAAGEISNRLYRNNKLTMALKSSFTLRQAKTVIIATVSPASKNTEHTLSTLRHACIMHGQSVEKGGESRFLTGGTVFTVEVGEVNVTEISRQHIAAKKANNPNLNAALAPKTSNGNFMEGSAQPEMTDKEREKNRRTAERKAFAKLTASLQELLTNARSKLRDEPRQARRLQRATSTYSSASEVDSLVGLDMSGVNGESLRAEKVPVLDTAGVLISPRGGGAPKRSSRKRGSILAVEGGLVGKGDRVGIGSEPVNEGGSPGTVLRRRASTTDVISTAIQLEIDTHAAAAAKSRVPNSPAAVAASSSFRLQRPPSSPSVFNRGSSVTVTSTSVSYSEAGGVGVGGRGPQSPRSDTHSDPGATAGPWEKGGGAVGGRREPGAHAPPYKEGSGKSSTLLNYIPCRQLPLYVII